MRTYDLGDPSKRIRLSSLATEVGNIIRRFIEVCLHTLPRPIAR